MTPFTEQPKADSPKGRQVQEHGGTGESHQTVRQARSIRHKGSKQVGAERILRDAAYNEAPGG